MCEKIADNQAMEEEIDDDNHMISLLWKTVF